MIVAGMKRWGFWGMVIATFAGLVAIGWWLVAGVHIPVLDPSGWVGIQQRNLMLFTLGLAVIVVVPVFVLLIVFAIKYRDGNNKATYRPEWSKNNLLEILWWGIPIIIISILATVTWFTSHSLDPYKQIESHKKPVEVQVVALQWKWLFIYPEKGVATVGKLPVPVGTPVHFSLTADAPMSAFWVPSLGSQIYSMNGMDSQLNLIANKPGNYKGYNTNINGEGYSRMTFTVHAMSQSAFDGWLQSAQHTNDVLNEKTYQKLARPGIEKSPREFRSEPGLYDTILAKYMHGSMNMKTTNHDQPDSASSGHVVEGHTDMSNMEGM